MAYLYKLKKKFGKLFCDFEKKNQLQDMLLGYDMKLENRNTFACWTDQYNCIQWS